MKKNYSTNSSQFIQINYMVSMVIVVKNTHALNKNTTIITFLTNRFWKMENLPQLLSVRLATE